MGGAIPGFFGLHIGFVKTNWVCLYRKLIYEGFIFGFRGLVSAMGGRFGQGSPQGFGAADVSAGDCGIFEFLQAVAAAGDGGIGADVHGAG